MIYFPLCCSSILHSERFSERWASLWSCCIGIRAPHLWEDVVGNVMSLWNFNAAPAAWCKACVSVVLGDSTEISQKKMGVWWAGRISRCTHGLAPFCAIMTTRSQLPCPCCSFSVPRINRTVCMLLKNCLPCCQGCRYSVLYLTLLHFFFFLESTASTAKLW